MICGPELFDLHVHSTRSDGVRSVMELAHLARLCGLSGLAITDHDILPDESMLQQASTLRGVELLAGVELSTVWRDRRFHLLAYGFRPSAGALSSLCEEILSSRRQRWDALIAGVRQQRVPLDEAFVQRVRTQGSPGRKHLARELVRIKRSTSVKGAFARYLSAFDGSLPAIGVDLCRAIEVVHADGGKAILAHPPTGMTVDEWRALARVGLDGLETRFGRLAQRHRAFLEDRAREYGWLTTAGSDYHGDSNAHRLGQHTVGRETLDQLRQR
jgi:predicted metal-dependent phosphoesterase TrpH